MIKAITITNNLGESIRLDLADPWSSGFIIKSIDGLGPSKATVNFTELATNDGAIDNSVRLNYRNIVLNLQFLDDNYDSIEDIRLLTYKYFPVKQNITFEIETDNRICEATGRVESNEPDIFSDEEGCKISILCPDPYFYSSGSDSENLLKFYGTEPIFEFPFENDLDTASSISIENVQDYNKNDIYDSSGDTLVGYNYEHNNIEFGNIENQTIGIITYNGDDEIGITIYIHASGEAKGLTIYNTITRESMAIDDDKLTALTGSSIQAGDDITINTTRGKKSITLLRDGETINILNALSRPISWFQLSKGDNVFAYTAEAGLSNLQFSISNKTIYEGV
jgi:hypothetical protein